MQLDGELVDFDVADDGLWKHALHLEDDGRAEAVATWTTEGQSDLVDLVVVGDHVLGHGQGNGELGSRLATDLLLDWDAEHVYGDLEVDLLISQSQSAAILPWPVSVVEDLDLNNLCHAWGNLKDFFGFLEADGASLLPVLLALEVPVLALLLHPLLELLLVEVLAIAEVLHEGLHHLAERWTTGSATTSTASTSTAAAATATEVVFSTTFSKLLHNRVEEVHWVLRLFLVGRLGLLFVKHGDHDIWIVFGAHNLEHGVLLTHSLLALGTVVKVLADGALVADAYDWADTAAIAGHAIVNGLGLIGGHVGVWKIIRGEKLLESILGLSLELSHDKVLESLSWDAALALILLFLLGFHVALGLLTLILHVHVVGSRCVPVDAEENFLGATPGNGEGKL